MIRQLVAIAIALWFALPSGAQVVGPDGNAHPQHSAAPDDRPLLHNPFGHMRSPGGASARERVEAMIAFEKALDLTPLKTTAVFHGGRVKILDSLAREASRSITGRPGLRVEIDAYESLPAIRHQFSPMYTLMEFTIHPIVTADQPLVQVEYLPLREIIVRIALADQLGRMPSTEEIDAGLRSTRVPPLWIDRYGPLIASEVEFDKQLRDGWERVTSRTRLWELSWGNWLVVAPAGRDSEWFHLAEDHAGAGEAKAAALALGAAWRDRDATRANAEIVRLAESLGAIEPEIYPGETRRSIELSYNSNNPFGVGAWMYLLAGVALTLGAATGRRWLKVSGLGLLTVAGLIHFAGFAARCYLAERFAIQNQFESMTGVSLFATIAGVLVMAWRRNVLFGAAAALAGFMVLLTATEMAIPGKEIGREAAILNTSVLLKYHVTTVLTSYGLISLGFVLSLFYLGVHYGPRVSAFMLGSGAKAESAGEAGAVSANTEGPIKVPSRVLKDLDKATMTVLQLAFWTLGVGILLGAWWADHSWGRWWAWDPKETWALITWIIYLIVIHVRLIARRRELITAWLSVAGFIVMLWTYFGVNLLLPGLHAYA